MWYLWKEILSYYQRPIHLNTRILQVCAVGEQWSEIWKFRNLKTINPHVVENLIHSQPLGQKGRNYSQRLLSLRKDCQTTFCQRWSHGSLQWRSCSWRWKSSWISMCIRYIYHTILMIEMVNIPYHTDIVSLPSPSSVRYGMVTTLITCVVRSPASYWTSPPPPSSHSWWSLQSVSRCLHLELAPT